MRVASGLDKFAVSVLVVCVGILVSGTKACQTDYEVGSQSKVPDPTATVAATATGDATPTVQPTGTADGTPTATPTVDATQTEAAELTAEATISGADIFNELSKIGNTADAPGRAPAGGMAAAAGLVKPENWLGEAFSKDQDGSWQDSDGDGFSDSLEEDEGTDPNSAGSAPGSVMVTRLAARVGSAEALSEEGLTEERESQDTDSDGVSDETEEQRGMNPRSSDSDRDGLTDNRELALGTNPLQIDSDDDGISDGREYEFGADPTIPEPR